jgi:ABC-type nitrate/sulfonate/bicarbonate transport system substrate-binding protein
MNDRREENWSRRKFVGGLMLGGTAGLPGLQAKQVAAQPPPETTRITVDWSGSTSQAPRCVAEELLRAEGFMVQSPQRESRLETSLRLQTLGSGRTDFDLVFAPDFILGLEASLPIVILAGLHAGCFELFGSERVRAIRDLKGKTIAVFEKGSVEHLFLVVILAYVGLNAEKDVHWVVRPSVDAVQLLAEGKVDASGEVKRCPPGAAVTGCPHAKQKAAPVGSSVLHFGAHQRETGAALPAELHAWWILVLAPRTLHARPSARVGAGTVGQVARA